MSMTAMHLQKVLGKKIAIMIIKKHLLNDFNKFLQILMCRLHTVKHSPADDMLQTEYHFGKAPKRNMYSKKKKKNNGFFSIF